MEVARICTTRLFCVSFYHSFLCRMIAVYISDSTVLSVLLQAGSSDSIYRYIYVCDSTVLRVITGR